MPRGGTRPGAGRVADPNSKRQKALAARAARAAAEAAFAPAGEKVPDAPKEWPFGTILAVPAEWPDLSSLTPLDYLLSVVRDPEAEQRIRIQAASIAAPFVHV